MSCFTFGSLHTARCAWRRTLNLRLPNGAPKARKHHWSRVRREGRMVEDRMVEEA